MSRWTDEYIQANNIKQHYWRTGGEKPPVVLLHGITDNGLCWERVGQRLEPDYDVIMLDARGHGLSDSPVTDLSTSQLAEDVAALIEALNLQRPHLMGHSMGARTASEVAALYPDRVRSLVLEDPAWFSIPSSEEEQEIYKLGFRQWHQNAAQQKGRSREEVVAQARESNPAWDSQDIEPWADAQIQFHLEILDPDLCDFLLPWRQRPWQSILQQLTCPALLVTADPRRGSLITAEQAEEAAQLAHDLRVVYIADAGHNIRRDQYEPFVQAVTTFLKEH